MKKILIFILIVVLAIVVFGMFKQSSNQTMNPGDTLSSDLNEVGQYADDDFSGETMESETSQTSGTFNASSTESLSTDVNDLQGIAGDDSFSSLDASLSGASK